jgi:hypothetical protein
MKQNTGKSSGSESEAKAAFRKELKRQIDSDNLYQSSKASIKSIFAHSL